MVDGAISNLAGKDYAILQYLKPINVYLRDKDVTEISLCRPQEVWLNTSQGWLVQPVPELTASYLKALITAIITYNGLSQKSLMYVTLPHGERGTIVLPPAIIDGTVSLVIRKHAQAAKNLDELHNEGAFELYRDVSFNKPSAQLCDEYLGRQDFTRLEEFEVELLRLKREHQIIAFLEACVLAKRNIVIAGKTGSGKTTFARSLIEKVPTSERVVTIEDVHELFLPKHPNRVHMLYGSGAGRVSADECLAACMRLSPDRIFLAELRGNEAWEYLNSLNTGHPGSITTTHANSAIQTFERVATLIKKSEIGRQLDLDMIRFILHTTLDVILYFEDRKLIEVFYDPIFAKGKLNV